MRATELNRLWVVKKKKKPVKLTFEHCLLVRSSEWRLLAGGQWLGPKWNWGSPPHSGWHFYLGDPHPQGGARLGLWWVIVKTCYNYYYIVVIVITRYNYYHIVVIIISASLCMWYFYLFYFNTDVSETLRLTTEVWFAVMALLLASDISHTFVLL